MGAIRIVVVTVGPRARTPIVPHRHRHAVAADGGSPLVCVTTYIAQVAAMPIQSNSDYLAHVTRNVLQ